eukprot:CAMPEP_0204580470 /NCGR_PEP_ID=MMETSP0661-20131031/44081_1 /ASSEMBLY_ACC=CAM_ASM_000606 /TAXON_ID=109239 /ORGANISM="Alexandrium margalefi, Strain AMGDE01CS-322" /LENGTH=49 /DNA_ID= /DNA_START= /DNA_END= /DNA_ORIENTATION=
MKVKDASGMEAIGLRNHLWKEGEILCRFAGGLATGSTLVRSGLGTAPAG